VRKKRTRGGGKSVDGLEKKKEGGKQQVQDYQGGDVRMDGLKGGGTPDHQRNEMGQRNQWGMEPKRG